MCEDHFPKQSRNIDYSGIDTEFFSQQTIFIIKRMDTRDFQIILLLVLNI